MTDCGNCTEKDNRLHAFKIAAKQVKAERDEALELLREVLLQTNDAWWHRDMCERIQKFVAKHQPPPCERCGGEREIAKGGERYLAEMVPCPDCAEGEA